MNLRDKTVVVVGLGQTGIRVCAFLAKRGANIIATDKAPASKLTLAQQTLRDLPIQWELGGHNTGSFQTADLVVTSPGIPSIKEFDIAKAAGVEVIAEIELAYRFFHPQATLIAITGTNGKTTTTALTGNICATSNRPTFCGGNLGNHPLIDAVDHPANTADGIIVAEVAGFMLEHCVSFRPNIAACLNITPDHLDRYGTFDIYASMKQKIFQWQRPGDIAIANAECSLSANAAKACPADTMLFSTKSPKKPGAYTNDAYIFMKTTDQQFAVARHELPMIGLHNAENAMAAYLCCVSAGISVADIREGTKTFVPHKHRMEKIAEKNDVLFYDDSKGTNVAATTASLRKFPRPVVLIAGGVDKGGSYAPIMEILAEVGKGLIVLGEAAPLLQQAAQTAKVSIPVIAVTSMQQAVTQAHALCVSGDAVVLSPACSSYDMYKNYMQRGQDFCDNVTQLLNTI